MARDAIREMKRQLRQGMNAQADEVPRRLAEVAALALLDRSVRMRHKRLAVQRLNDAAVLGVHVPDEHWMYCRDAAMASRDAVVQALFDRAERAMRAMHKAKSRAAA